MLHKLMLILKGLLVSVNICKMRIKYSLSSIDSYSAAAKISATFIYVMTMF